MDDVEALFQDRGLFLVEVLLIYFSSQIPSEGNDPWLCALFDVYKYDQLVYLLVGDPEAWARCSHN